MSAANAGSFFFRATRPDGRPSFGVRAARNEAQLAEQLRRERLVLLQSWRLPAWAAASQGLRLKDQSEMHTQLAQLLSRGVPLVEALDVTAQAVTPKARPRIMKMREQVQAGSSLADACKSQGVFDTVTIAVYRAAERTGDLAGAAKALSVSTKRQLEIAGKAITLMIYPAIVLVIAFLVAGVMITFIVPMIGEAITKANPDAKIPGITKVLIAVGQFIQGSWPLVLAGFALALLALWALRRGLVSALVRSARVLPLVKDLVLAQELARFFNVMAAMCRCAVPIADGLAIAVQVVKHPKLRAQLETMRRRLVEGGLLRNLVESVDAFPLATRRLLIAADRAGDIDHAFEGLALDLAEEVDRRSSRVLAALNPLVVVFLFVIIAGLLMSVMIPMMKIAGEQL